MSRWEDRRPTFGWWLRLYWIKFVLRLVPASLAVRARRSPVVVPLVAVVYVGSGCWVEVDTQRAGDRMRERVRVVEDGAVILAARRDIALPAPSPVDEPCIVSGQCAPIA
jgi:hypothetical protein